MHLKTIAKVVVLLSLGLFLGSRLLNGTLSFYIHPRFNALTLLTAVAFILIALIYARQSLVANKDEHAHEHEHAHDHEHHEHDLSWLGLAILALPVILGLVVQPRPLGAAALGNREINVSGFSSASAADGRQLTVVPPPGERNILDWLYLFQRANEPTELDGQEVRVVGFVYRDDRFGSDQFMVSRYTVSCCVADAAPIGLIVRWPQTPDLRADEWVEVSGRLQAATFAGVTIPVLAAEAVTKTEPPAQPYLYQ